MANYFLDSRVRMILLAGSAIGGALFVGNIAFALTNANQLVKDTSSYTATIYQGLGTGFTNGHYFLKLTVATPLGIGTAVQAQLIRCTATNTSSNGDYCTAFGASYTGGYVVATSTDATSTDPMIWRADLGNLTIDSGDNVFMVLTAKTGTASDWKWYGSATSTSYVNGNAVGNRCDDTSVGTNCQQGMFGSGVVYDVYFHLGDEISPDDGVGQRDPVVIIPGILGSWYKNGAWMIDPVTHTYDNLLHFLEANGYQPGVDLFTFPYDWRQSVSFTKDQLGAKIQEIRALCGCEKVDVIAHSMGGLVARAYAQSDGYGNDIDQIIFLGAPHEGSSFAYLLWEAGELTPDILSLDYLIERFARIEAIFSSFPTTFDYIRNNILSIRDLLPTYDYLKEADTGNLRSYPGGYPPNLFLETLNSPFAEARLSDRGIRLTNIVGNIEPNFLETRRLDKTLGTIRVTDSPFPHLPMLWEHGYPENYDAPFTDHGLEFAEGDRRVPLHSAAHNFSPVVLSDPNPHLHSELPTVAWRQISEALFGAPAPAPEAKAPVEHLLLIPVFSSVVDVQVVDPQGRRMGKDFSNNQEVNEIPEAFYSGASNEFVAVPEPLDGEYRILVEGLEEGSFKVETSYLAEENSSQASFTARTRPGLIEELRFDVSSSTPEEMIIIPRDATPPSISHTDIQSDYVLNAAPVIFHFSAEDALTGVFSVAATLDGRPFPSGGLIRFDTPGPHALEIRAEDFVGNVSSQRIAFNVVYRFLGLAPPLKADGSYQSGRVLPVKFRLTDALGQFVSDATARLTLARVENGVAGSEEASHPAGAANKGNLFRYDPVTHQYAYNLSTRTMTKGKWQLRVRVDDGQEHRLVVTLR